MIKCAEGVNYYGNIIKNIYKSNETVVCPVCDAHEDCDHVILCEKNKGNTEEWIKVLEKKMKEAEKHKHAEEE